MLKRLSIIEFCYWLQGAIEIGGLNNIEEAQKQLILKRLNSIERHNYFTLSSKVILENYSADIAFAAINEELQNMFKHDIDPSYEGDQEHFQSLHDGRIPLDEENATDDQPRV